MPLHTIGKLLSATEELKVLQARARRIQELQTLYLTSAPRELASASHVKNCRAGTLYISADNSAVAAKLKQLAPRLVAALREFEPEVTGVRIDVKVSETHRAYKSPKKALARSAVEEFDTLARKMPDGALKSALANLVKRHSGNSKT
jgi:hypothetical protein